MKDVDLSLSMNPRDNPFFVYLKGEEKKMEKLKEFIIKEGKTQQCSNCKGDLQVLYSPKRLPYEYNGEVKNLTIINAPYRYCNTCNEGLENLKLYSLLRDLLEQEIFLKLNNRDGIPDKINLLEIAG